jgi:malate permease and related proteins
MPFDEILRIILPIFITVVIGFVIGKVIKIDISGAIDLLVYIGIPAIVFVSIAEQPIVLIDAAKIWGSVLLVSLGCGAAAWIIFKIFRIKHPVLYLPVSLPNTVNIPFPIVSMAYGPAGMAAATLYYIPNMLLLYSAGVFIAAGRHWKHNLKEMLKLPMIYAAVLALILNFAGVTVPAIVLEPLAFIGNMVIPLVLLTLGFSLSKVRITSFPTTLLTSLLRLGLGLLLGTAMVYLFDLEGVVKSVVILVSAMPSAMNTYIVAEKYKNEPQLVASVVLVTTVASLITIPFLLRIL